MTSYLSMSVGNELTKKNKTKLIFFILYYSYFLFCSSYLILTTNCPWKLLLFIFVLIFHFYYFIRLHLHQTHFFVLSLSLYCFSYSLTLWKRITNRYLVGRSVVREQKKTCLPLDCRRRSCSRLSPIIIFLILYSPSF